MITWNMPRPYARVTARTSVVLPDGARTRLSARAASSETGDETAAQPRHARARPMRSEPEMTISPVNGQAERYGNAFLRSDAPDHHMPAVGMSATDALRLLEEEIAL